MYKYFYIGKKKIKRYDILYYDGDYIGVADYCDKRLGWSLKEFDSSKGKLEECLCHCYQCSGHFELCDLDVKRIEIKGNICNQKKNK